MKHDHCLFAATALLAFFGVTCSSSNTSDHNQVAASGGATGNGGAKPETSSKGAGGNSTLHSGPGAGGAASTGEGTVGDSGGASQSNASSASGGTNRVGRGGGRTSGAGEGGSGGAGGGSRAEAGGSSNRGGKASAGGADHSDAGGPARGGAGGKRADAGDGGGKADVGGSTSSCSRELLKNTVDAYFKALAAHDASTLPLADNVKATENGKTIKVGQDGLWKGAGKLEYVHTAYDERSEGCGTVCCTSVSEASLPDGGKEIVVALRLKLIDQKISEIETIAPHDSNDYMLGPDGKALAASDKTVHWETPPSGKAATRKEMVDWIDKYFSTFPNGFCDFAADCKRLENGADANLKCTAGGQCTSGTGSMSMKPRNLMADEATGIGVGWTMFNGQYTDVHMIKMSDGQVHSVSAILSKSSSSGW